MISVGNSMLMCALLKAEQRQEKWHGWLRISKSLHHLVQVVTVCSTDKHFCQNNGNRPRESVFDYAIKMVNRISFRPLNARVFGGMWWRSWLRHCTTSLKVADLIPDGVSGIFH